MGTVERTEATIGGTGDKTALGRRSEYACMRQWLEDALEKPDVSDENMARLTAASANALRYLTCISEGELELLLAEMLLHGDGVTRPGGDMKWRVYRVLGATWMQKISLTSSNRDGVIDRDAVFGDHDTAKRFSTRAGAAARIRRLLALKRKDGTPEFPTDLEYFLVIQNVQVVH